ncbi:olfactory receptor 287-like [Leptodactylus fuscus]|uniref:olfactory receptor 287-like n=1 Tax=Leptodactylus fuscus TaxID=238119 RepID=UPI003F4EEC05
MQNNLTVVTEFLLVGFTVVKQARFGLFLLIGTVYVVTISANVFIIIIIGTDQRLHKPMYFFIGGLSFLEIWYPSVTVPRLLWSLLTENNSISPAGCITQFFFHFSLGAVENFLLAIMAYDRYVAVCNPLRYLLIMYPELCKRLLIGSWVLSFGIFAIPSAQMFSLSFCAQREIDSYYCDFAPVIKLSCSNTMSIEKQFFVIVFVIILGCFTVIIVSYICIIWTTVKLPTSGRHKTFSTCASHLIVVLLFYGTTMFMFIRPTAGDFSYMNKIISVIPSIVTPLLNPIIYTLRNREAKEAMKKAVQKIRK